jgi:hypothetical protein
MDNQTITDNSLVVEVNPLKSAVVNGVLTVSLKKLWYTQTTTKGNQQRNSGATFEPPAGTEIILGLPLSEGVTIPEPYLTVDQIVTTFKPVMFELSQKLEDLNGEGF